MVPTCRRQVERAAPRRPRASRLRRVSSWRPALVELEGRNLLSFLPPVANNVGGVEPLAVSVGDVNNDGIPDLVTANAGTYPDHADSSISVLLGNGDGTFAPPLVFAAGSKAQAVTLGDFDGDGNLDVAVTAVGGTEVSVWRGNGDGTFQDGVAYDAGAPLGPVAVGDLNNDGSPDLVAGGSGGLYAFLGNGDGTFGAVIPSPGYGAGSLTLGDLNGDGNLDAVTTAVGVGLFWGNGDGTFQFYRAFDPGGVSPRSVALGDFNGDGYPDIAVANYDSRNLGIILSTGGGLFQPVVSYAGSGASTSVAVGDFNQDGYADVVLSSDDGASVYLANPDGSLQARSDYFFGGFAYHAAVGDFNQDGYPDVVVADWYANDAWVLVNAADWGPGPAGAGRGQTGIARALDTSPRGSGAAAGETSPPPPAVLRPAVSALPDFANAEPEFTAAAGVGRGTAWSGRPATGFRVTAADNWADPLQPLSEWPL